MHKLLVSPEAESDLERIYEYTFLKWNEKQADKYQDSLYDGMQTILSITEIGELYTYAKINYRKFQINKHLIFYTVEKMDCIVVRILHERMNLNANLRSD